MELSSLRARTHMVVIAGNLFRLEGGPGGGESRARLEQTPGEAPFPRQQMMMSCVISLPVRNFSFPSRARATEKFLALLSIPLVRCL